MEFEDLDELIEWEARCVAAAFEVKERAKEEDPNISRFKGWGVPNLPIEWTIDYEDDELNFLRVGRLDQAYIGESPWILWRHWNGWEIQKGTSHHELMSRGFYRLGVKDQHVLNLFPGLSAHEKLELRLSMSREFWPQKWRSEDLRPRFNL